MAACACCICCCACMVIICICCCIRHDLLLLLHLGGDFHLRHFHQCLERKVAAHDLGGDLLDVARHPHHLALLVADAHAAVLRLELLRAQRLAGVGSAAHDVGQPHDLVDVLDDLLPDGDH